jgi:hypothetical protein
VKNQGTITTQKTLNSSTNESKDTEKVEMPNNPFKSLILKIPLTSRGFKQRDR